MKSLNQKEYDEIENNVESFTGIEKRYFRYLTTKYCSINGKPLSEYRIINILGHDEITTMTIVRDLDNNFDCLMELVKKTKDHTQWEIDEEYYLQQEAKDEAEDMEQSKNMDEIENKLRNLTKTELLCFRDLLMNNYPIYAMAYDIETIMHTIDGVGGTIEEINELLEIVYDHTKWEVSEAEYLEDIENGIFEDDEKDDVEDGEENS